jgi:hypothetical protein
MAAARSRWDLRADRKGAAWDALLYVPTVIALASVAVKLWYSGDQALAYVLAFLASFFFLVGANRILKTRLLLLPSAAVRLEVLEGSIAVVQRDGTRNELVKDSRHFPDFAGRSYGLSGLDGGARRLQFVLHRGQFSDEKEFLASQDAIKRFSKPGR